MITLLVLIIPTLIILNRLENSRSRRKVSVDGFKMINGHIARRAEDRHAGSAVDTDPTTSLRRNRNRDRDADRQAS
jgi:hypothetical protein